MIVPVTEVMAPHLGRTVKLGRQRPRSAPRRYLHEFLTSEPLPVPPASQDWSPKALAAIKLIYKNDALGCCVVAAKGHAIGTFTGNAGSLITLSDEQIIAQYEVDGNYRPGRPWTDQGCNEQDALDNWIKADFAGVTESKLLGYVGVNAADRLLVQQCIVLNGGVLLGFEMPDKWINPLPSADGWIWNVAGPPNPRNGHAVWGFGYTDVGVLICSWGMFGMVTWAALAEYCVTVNGGELYALFTTLWMNRATAAAPNGIDWNKLVTYFNTEGGQIPVPPIVPPIIPPVIPPVTPPPVPASGVINLGIDVPNRVVSFGLPSGWKIQVQ